MKLTKTETNNVMSFQNQQRQFWYELFIIYYYNLVLQ